MMQKAHWGTRPSESTCVLDQTLCQPGWLGLHSFQPCLSIPGAAGLEGVGPGEGSREPAEGARGCTPPGGAAMGGLGGGGRGPMGRAIMPPAQACCLHHALLHRLPTS